jgi:hypothetical protein
MSARAFILLLASICFEIVEGFVPAQQKIRIIGDRILPITPTSTPVATSLKSSTETETTFTVPSYLGDDDGEGDYPSPLHKIHVRSLMSEEQAKKCCQISLDFAERTGRFLSPDSERHQSYSTCDFPVEDCDALQHYLDDIDFDGLLFSDLSELYGIDKEDMEYLDLFVAHYQAKDSTDSEVMDRLEAHRDGSLLSFSLLLNDPSDFEGGGTFYDALRDVEPSGILHPNGNIRPSKAGDAVLHCGKLLHGADVVTKGSRTVLVGFIDVSERCQRPGVLAEACTDFGRMDVASYRFKRQESKNHKAWKLNHNRWIQGHAHIRGYAPAFASVVRRADREYQRRVKLIAEDRLLRWILLPEDERPESIYGGEISIIDDE